MFAPEPSIKMSIPFIVGLTAGRPKRFASRMSLLFEELDYLARIAIASSRVA